MIDCNGTKIPLQLIFYKYYIYTYILIEAVQFYYTLVITCPPTG